MQKTAASGVAPARFKTGHEPPRFTFYGETALSMNGRALHPVVRSTTGGRNPFLARGRRPQSFDARAGTLAHHAACQIRRGRGIRSSLPLVSHPWPASPMSIHRHGKRIPGRLPTTPAPLTGRKTSCRHPGTSRAFTPGMTHRPPYAPAIGPKIGRNKPSRTA